MKLRRILCLLLVFVWLCPPCWSAILWAGGEDISFPNGAAVKTFATAGRFRSGYARFAVANTSSGAPSLTPCVGNTFPGGAVTSAWLSFQLYVTLNANTTTTLAGFTHSSKTAGEGLYVGYTSANKLRLTTWDGSSLVQLAIEAGTSANVTGLYRITMQLIDYGATATVHVFVNGVEQITFTDGDVRISSLTNVDRVGFAGEGNGDRRLLSEFIVATTDTSSMGLVTYAPNADGDTVQWTGGYASIDENSADDSDTVYVNSDAQKEQINLTATPAGSFSVDAIVIAARALATGDSTVTTLKLGAKSGGSEDVDAGQALTAAWATKERLAATLNGAQITTALLDAMQLQMQSAP